MLRCIFYCFSDINLDNSNNFYALEQSTQFSLFKYNRWTYFSIHRFRISSLTEVMSEHPCSFDRLKPVCSSYVFRLEFFLLFKLCKKNHTLLTDLNMTYFWFGDWMYVKTQIEIWLHIPSIKYRSTLFSLPILASWIFCLKKNKTVNGFI